MKQRITRPNNQYLKDSSPMNFVCKLNMNKTSLIAGTLIPESKATPGNGETDWNYKSLKRHLNARNNKASDAPSILSKSVTLNSTVATIYINFVAQNYKGKIFWIRRARLYKELFSPVEIIKWLLHIHVIHKNTAICTAVESNSKALKSFLSSCIPDLQSEEPVLKFHFFCQEISTNCCLVLIAKLLVYILIHQGCFSNPAGTEDDDFEKRSSSWRHRNWINPDEVELWWLIWKAVANSSRTSDLHQVLCDNLWISNENFQELLDLNKIQDLRSGTIKIFKQISQELLKLWYHVIKP